MSRPFTLEPIGPDYLGADLGNTLQLHNALEWVVNQTGSANITVVTFSISEEFIRKVYQLKKRDLIKSIHLILDFKAVQKTTKLIRFYENVFDQVNYCKIHAKAVMIESEKLEVCITGSQNATRGNRHESIIITTRDEIILPFKTKIKNLKTINYDID